MPRYFFDVRDNNELIADEAGLELRDAAMARDEAERALADFVKEVVPSQKRRELTIEVRDQHRSVARACMVLEIQMHGPA